MATVQKKRRESNYDSKFQERDDTKEARMLRVQELKSRFQNHIDMLAQTGTPVRTMKRQLKEFLTTITDWKSAYSNEELATLFNDITYGKSPNELTDSEYRRRHKALQNTRNLLANIRRSSNSVMPVSIKQLDMDDGSRKWRTLNLTTQSQLNKRINDSESIKEGIDKQDTHIEEVFELGQKSRKENLVEERIRRKKKVAKN